MSFIIDPFRVVSVVNTSRAPGAGSIVLAGEAPLAAAGRVFFPGAGAIALSGAAPTFAVATPTAFWDIATANTGHTLSNGNYTDVCSASVQNGIRATAGYPTIAGLDRYFEITFDSFTGTVDIVFGIGTADMGLFGPGTFNDEGYSYDAAGKKWNGAGPVAYGASFTAGDVIGVRLNGTALTFYKNGVSQGLAFTLPSDGRVWYPAWAPNTTAGPHQVTLNTGNAAFNALPSGSTAWGTGTENRYATPSARAVTLAGLAPIATTAVIPAPGVRAVTLTGLAPTVTGMPETHRYWRITNLTTPANNNDVAIDELQLWTDASTRADSSSTPLSTDSTVVFGTIDRLVDGSVASYVEFFPFTSAKVIVWDFGSNKIVTGFKYAHRAGGGSSGAFTQLRLQWSDDNSSWTTFGNATGIAFSADTLSAFTPFS